MSWREELRRVRFGDRDLVGASFRGVSFFVDASERSGGRRAVVHEFPFRDDPYVEDLGRKARSFRVDGYLIGADYLTQRDLLLAALEDESAPGELVHPYHGVLRVVCMTLSVRESRTDGGFATLAMEFAEAPTQEPVPTEVVDAAAQVASSADAATAATSVELAAQFRITTLPAFAIQSAEVALTYAVAGLDAALAPVASTTQELAELAGRTATLTARASSLVRQPADVLGEFRSVIAGMVNTIAAAPRAVMDALLDTYSLSLGTPVDATTATRARERANQDALSAALRRVMVIEAARLAPVVPYPSIDEATAARDQIAALLDEQAALAGDDAYPALVDLRSQVLRAVPGGTAFASVVPVTRRVATPSLLLAYQIYGAVDLEPDIIARNRVRHPGFIAGDLKVLSDG